MRQFNFFLKKYADANKTMQIVDIINGICRIDVSFTPNKRSEIKNRTRLSQKKVK